MNAHSPCSGRPHLLTTHLRSVAESAQSFLKDVCWGQEAYLAGLLHDLGKAGDLFQRRLQGEERGLDHWSPGAWVALERYRSPMAALAIQGHHIGLQRGAPAALMKLRPENMIPSHPQGLRLTGHPDELLRFLSSDLGLPPPASSPSPLAPGIGGMLATRMIFSALVDADYLDTEAHFQGDASGKRYRPSGPELQAQEALKLVLDHLKQLAGSTCASRDIREVRQKLLDDALKAAEADPGLFTFTAPTGSGKTLAMLAFALAHAQRHGLRRVVLAVPYLSILEQTAKIYRDLFEPYFGHAYVLEHHSLAGLGEETKTDMDEKERLRRLHSENWDAPVVLTTNVQLLESLFSNRPSACRKLHRLARSVILFDEAQALPTRLAVPTLAALSHLAAKTGSSVVFATATQPAFASLSRQVQQNGGLAWQPQEAVASSQELFKKCRRVTPDWALKDGAWDMKRLADELRARPQVLCILNLKRHALELTCLLKDEDGVFHLSTNLCPVHRQAVLSQVRQCLAQGLPCRLIATQCVEAGVDLDFPEVFRALGPLEAIAQAAGRCNREGRLETGRLTVFEPEDEGYPSDIAYEQAAKICRSILKEKDWCLDLDDPATYEDYYRRFFDLNRPESRVQELLEYLRAQDFVETAKAYRLIKQDAINVLVPWQGHEEKYQNLRRQEENNGINADWMRQAQALAVGIFRPKQSHPAWGVLVPARIGFRKVESEDWFLLNDVPGWSYDEVTGLALPHGNQVMIA